MIIKIFCTYCWCLHYARSLEEWMAIKQTGCGSDPDRYFLTKAEYRAYVKLYDGQHIKKTDLQLKLF